MKQLYLKIIELCKNQPPLAVFFGVVLVFVLGLGGNAMFHWVAPESAPSFSTFALLFLFVLLLLIVLVAVLEEQKAKPSAPPLSEDISGPYDTVLIQAVEQLRSMVRAKWLKSDLAFSLKVDLSPDSPTKAIVLLDASFRVRNRTDSEVPFLFLTEVEVAGTESGHVQGRLKITDEITMMTDTHVEIHLNRTRKPSVRRYSLQRQLQPLHEYRYEWSVGPYLVDLPYCEYWASAHPTVNLKVEIQCSDPSIVSEAIVYRPADQGPEETVEDAVGSYKIQVPGPFLPYQGIFVRMMPGVTDELGQQQ